MNQSGQISPRQIFILVYITRTTVAIAKLPVLTVGPAKEDAWLSALVATCVGTGIVWLLGTTAIQLQGRTVMEYLLEAFGPLLGRLMGLSFLWVYLESSALVLRQYGEGVVTGIVPETPIVFVMGVMIALAGIGVRYGPEVIARMGELIFPVYIASIFLVPILAINLLDPAWLRPFLGQGITPVLIGAVTPSIWYGEAVFLLVTLSLASDRRQARTAACCATLAAGFTNAILAAVVVIVFGAQEGARLTFPVYELARLIRVGGFLTRLEALAMMAWGLGLFVKLMVTFHAGSVCLAQWLALPTYRPLVLSMGAILLSMAMALFQNTAEADVFQSPLIWSVYRGTLTVLVPVLLLIATRVRSPKPPHKRSVGSATAPDSGTGRKPA